MSSFGDPQNPSPESGPPRRRKVTRACDTCRRKKVRCDGEKPICSYCTSFGYECTYLDFLKKRGPRGNCPVGLEKRIKRLEAVLINLKDKDPQLYQQICSVDMPEDMNTTRGSSLNDRMGHDELEMAGNNSDGSSEDMYTLERAIGELTNNEKDQCRYLGPSSGAYLFESGSFYKRGIFRDFSMLTEIKSELKLNYPRTREDFDYICDINTNFPPPDVRKHLLSIYFSHQHPYFPIFHKKWFLNRLSSGDKVSGALLNAIFAVACLNSGNLTMYQNPTCPGITGDVFFHRAKKFLDIEWYASSVDNVQALILLSFHPAHSWHFLGNAIRMAQDLGLHRNLLDKGGADDIEKENRRRAWWGCYVLDRICSCGAGRSMSIDEADYDTILKFYEEAHTQPETEDEDTSISLKYFVQLITLSTLLGKVLKAIYPVRNTSALSSEDVLWILNKSLNHWYSSLPTEFQLGYTNLQTNYNPYSSILNAMYHWVMICLHRPFIPLPTSQFDSNPPSLNVCNHSASIINYIFHITPWQFMMHGAFLLWYPYSHASMVFMVSIFSKDSQVANTTLVNLSTYMHRVGKLKPAVHQVNTMFIFLEDLLHSREVKLLEDPSLRPIIIPLDQNSFSKSGGARYSRRSDSEAMVIYAEKTAPISRPQAPFETYAPSIISAAHINVSVSPTSEVDADQGPMDIFRNQAWNHNLFPTSHPISNPSITIAHQPFHSSGGATAFANPAYWNSNVESELQRWNSYIGQYTMDSSFPSTK